MYLYGVSILFLVFLFFSMCCCGGKKAKPSNSITPSTSATSRN